MLTKGTTDEHTTEMGKTCLTFHNGLKNFSKRMKLGKGEMGHVYEHAEMDPNDNCSDNMVFSQPLSHEQLQNNREVLARRLKLRRPREELVNQGIMPAVYAAPKILQQKTRLERAKTGDILQRKIRHRPNRNQLIQRHILEDSNADGSLQARQISLKRKKLQDDLNERLLMRPGPLELVNKNILEPGSMVSHAIKEGAIEYSDTKDSTLIKNALSPPESIVSDDLSPEPSPDTVSSIGSPPDMSQVGLFSPGGHVFQPSDNAKLNFQMPIQTAPAVIKPKEAKSRKKTNKSKFKKYKYHEYRPPNAESSIPKPESLPTDSPYSLLLQQQQLYLQLQVLCQNYPQTFLPLMPVQKSNQGDKNVGKPMKLEDMRVIDLRNELKSRGLPVSGSKNHLMERLKLANATQGATSTNQGTPGTTTYPAKSTMNGPTSVTSMVQRPTPIQAAQHTSLSRSISAPTGVAMVNPAKVMSEAEKILQSEQNISVEEIQQKIQQLQYLNLQIQLQQLDIKKNQQLNGKQQLQPKPADCEQQLRPFLPSQQQISQLQQQMQQQNQQQSQQQYQQQQQLQQQLQQLQQHQQQHQQQQQLQQQIQLQQQQQIQQRQQIQLQQQRQQQIQQQQQLQQQQQPQPQPPHQLKIDQQQQRSCTRLSPTQHQNVDRKLLAISTQDTKPIQTKHTTMPPSLPPPQQCQVSISATPLLHCSALSCPHTANHSDTTQTISNSQASLLNSVQQHNVIHFKQPVKPVIILQPPKLQQRAELLFSPPDSGLSNDVVNEAFFQQLSKSKQGNDDISMDHDTSWHNLIDDDASSCHSSAASPTSQTERSPPPYFEAVAGRLSPRTSSFSSTSSGSGVIKNPHSLSPDNTSNLGHRRSLSVPTVNQHNQANLQPQELQKGAKSSSMCFDFIDSGDAGELDQHYQGMTQELQKAMIMESQNDLDANNAELLELLGDALYSTSPGSLMSSSSPNLTTFSPYPNSNRPFSASSSPKGPRSPTTSLPSYEEAIQNTLSVQSASGKFGSNEILNNYDQQGSPVNIRQNSPGSRKSSVPSIDSNMLASPGSPMRVDSEDMELLQRGILDANDYHRDGFHLGDLRTHDVRGGSLFHVDPTAIFGNPHMLQDSRMIKQEETLTFLDIDPSADFPDSMEFGLPSDPNMSMAGIAYSQS